MLAPRPAVFAAFFALLAISLQAQRGVFDARDEEEGWTLRLRRGAPRTTAAVGPLELAEVDAASPQLVIVTRRAGTSGEQLARACAALGLQFVAYIPERASLMRGNAAACRAAQALPDVAGIEPYRVEDRLDPTLGALLDQAIDGNAPQWLALVVVCDHSLSKHALLIEAASRFGAEILDDRGASPLCSLRMELRRVREFAADARVLWMELETPSAFDLEHARTQMGLAQSPRHERLRGAGMRAEVYEGIDPWHTDFAAGPSRSAPRPHGCAGYSTHGTATFGILFGNGAGNARARGICPEAQGLWCDPSCDDRSRFDRAAELVDPRGPYRAMLQTASWGHQRTRHYNAWSAELDALLFEHDLVITQSQSNAGSQLSRPEAWAKNVIAVGGVFHNDNADAADDTWAGGSSIGPAEDGRIKPDFVGYYDQIETTVPGGYTANFGGSSGATPMVAGAALLCQQLFTAGAFDALPLQRAQDEFDRRAKASTIKALLTASARPYAFTGTHHDLARMHQGWGFPHLGDLDRACDGALVIDATAPLREGDSHRHTVYVEAGSAALRIALAWLEPPALPSVTRQLVNDLDLEARDPSGNLWLGNVGLLHAPWSQSGGRPDRINPTEAIFVAQPQAGLWTIQVRAHRVEVDAWRATPAWDVSYSLVALGGWAQARRLQQTAARCATTRLAIQGAPHAGGVLELFVEPTPAPEVQGWLLLAPSQERWGFHELPLALEVGAPSPCWLGVVPTQPVAWDLQSPRLRLQLPLDPALSTQAWSLQMICFDGERWSSTETWRVHCAP